jgi:hypothetical protein
VREHLVLDHRRVVLDIDGLDGERGNLGEEDAAEGVGEGGVEANEGEGGVELIVLVEFNGKARPEAIQGEGEVLPGVVARVIRRRDVRDRFLPDANRLQAPTR